MTTQGRINPERLSAFLEGLPDLLESLRAQGYGLGTRQHIAAHELVGSLVAHRQLPPTLLEFDEWLAPLICFTPAQQEDFRERYLQWLIEKRLLDKEDLPPAPPPVSVPPPPPVTPPPVRERIARRVHANRRPLIAAGATLVALFVIASALYFTTTPCPLSGPGPCPTPTPSAEPSPSAEPTPTTEPSPTSTPTLEQTPTPDVRVAWDVNKIAEVTPTPTLTPTLTPPRGFWVENFPYVFALTLVTPFAGLGLWHLLGRRRRRRDAERWRNERPRYDKIKVRGARERVFQCAALRPIARGLRRYLSVESRQLDARLTVHASVGRGGLFTPVYGRRRTLPEYLVLIDRIGFGDQLAQLNSDIATRLGEHDVYLDTYYFHGDPRRCREGGADSPQLSLSDLAARHPDHYLLIFSDGTGLLSTTTGRPEPFVEQLLHWRGRALLTPIPRLEWEYREWALEREGLKVLPASIDGLRALVEAVGPDARTARPPAFDETPPYPDILREQPTLWKERAAPPDRQTRRLVTHLRRYLGPKGFELLCACAVYPVMQWSVTLFLAYELLGRPEVEGVLPRLLRLPWFRNGSMPQWLRRVLVRELPRPRRRLVRERLEHLLLAFLEDPERGLTPRFAEEQTARDAASASPLTRLSERLTAWRRARRLRRRLEHAPARSPLAEPVFLNYITNNRHTEALPPTVRHKLFRRGIAAFGLRLAPAAALVAVAVLTGLFLLLLERPTDDIYTPGAPPDLLSRLLAPAPEQTTDPDFTYTPTTVKQGQTVDFTVSVVTPGEYDLSKMRIAPADPGGKITLKATRAGRKLSSFINNQITDSLTATVAVAPNAPPGPTELLLYDGDQLRARLPFNVAAAGQAPPQQQCPNFKFQAVRGAVDADQGTVDVRVVLVSPPAAPSLTYFWSGVNVIDGQGTRSVTVIGVFEAEGQQLLRVRVGGLPPGCPNTAIYQVSDAPANNSSSASQMKLTVEPSSIVVCPDNPKLNDPLDSNVTVTVLRGTVRDALSFDVPSGGRIIGEGYDRSNRPTSTWNFSGVSPGTYTYTARAHTQSPTPPTATGSVTVNGCPRAAAATDTQQEPPAGGTGQLRLSFDDQGKPVNLVGVDLSVRLVPRGGKAPQGFAQSKFVRTFKTSPDASVMSEFSFEGVPYGDYNLVVSSAQYYDASFPITVSQPSVLYTELKLKIRPTGR